MKPSPKHKVSSRALSGYTFDLLGKSVKYAKLNSYQTLVYVIYLLIHSTIYEKLWFSSLQLMFYTCRCCGTRANI